MPIRRWCRTHPKISGSAAALVVLTVLLGALGSAGGRATSPVAGRTPATAAPTTPSPGSVPPTGAGPAGAALALLATLPVKGRAAMTGYDRDRFGAAWTDDTTAPLGHNGCDTRNDVLRRDLTAVALRPGSHGCAVLTGVLHDPYTGTTIAFTRGRGTSNAVQIDHVVALGDAWQTGAARFDDRTRAALANDPLELLAVDGPTNEAKGDGDAATWLPPDRGYRCAYVARQVAVKARYRLWTTPAEHAAMARVLASCPGQDVPGEQR